MKLVSLWFPDDVFALTDTYQLTDYYEFRMFSGIQNLIFDQVENCLILLLIQDGFVTVHFDQ